MSISQITTRDTQLEKQRIGFDATMLELDVVSKVSVGSVIECSGALYVVTSAAETPTGSAVDGAYLFFDPSGPSFVWSAVAGTYDATKGGIYDGSNRRQCRFRLRSGTAWDQLVEPISPDVHIQNLRPKPPDVYFSTINVGAGSNSILARGYHNIHAYVATDLLLEMYNGTVWVGEAFEDVCGIFSDGANVRIRNPAGISRSYRIQTF